MRDSRGGFALALPNRSKATSRKLQVHSVYDDAEGAAQHLGGFAAHHHAKDKDFKVFHYRSDFNVDFELEGDGFGVGVDDEVRFLDGEVDAVVDIVRCRVVVL